MALSYEEVKQFILDEVSSVTGIEAGSVTEDSALVGQNRLVDSADLVVLLLAVEEFARERLGVQWDWTSDSAMSEARSVLRTVGSLARHLTGLQPA